MVSRPRGTRDFDITEMEKRRFIQKQMETIFKRFAYKEIATPTLEHLELFELKSGENIIDELYSFKDKGGRDIALRPELTAPVMRFYVEKLQMETKPLKFYYFGNCFRYDRPQEGRYREFWQMGCELIGSISPEAMAELIALAYHAIKKTGLVNIRLRIGNLNLLEKQIKKAVPTSSPPDFSPTLYTDIFRLIDKNDTEGMEQQLKHYKSSSQQISLFKKFLESNSIDDIANYFKDSTEDQADILDFKKMLDTLELFDVPTRDVIEMRIARGLDYYTGTVFEIEAPQLGAEKQLCGGGSYTLVPLLGGTEIPTAGFAIGFDRVMMALDKENYEFPFSSELIYVMSLDRDLDREVIKLVSQLRHLGFMVDFDLMDRAISRSLKYANKIGAKKTIILGRTEWDQGNVIVKDMQSGEQKEIKKEELEDFFS
jgi:histidyl-tRNA synthetase